MLTQLEQMQGWKATHLKDMRSEINPSTSMAIMVGALNEPTKTIIDITATQALFISPLAPGNPSNEPKPAQWSLRVNRWNRSSNSDHPTEETPAYQSKAVEALNRAISIQEGNAKDPAEDFEMGEEELDDGHIGNLAARPSTGKAGEAHTNKVLPTPAPL